jgi:hypothetical protein
VGTPALHQSTEQWRDQSTEQWRSRALLEMNRMRGACRRYSEAITLRDRSAKLTAANELEAATKDADAWLSAHPCSDAKLEAHFEGMLNTSALVALIAQRTVTDPPANIGIPMGRVGRLLAEIEIDGYVLEGW